LTVRERQPSGAHLKDLEDLVETEIEQRVEVERRVDRGDDRVERDELLIAALDLDRELSRRPRVVGEPAGRAGVERDLLGRAEHEGIAFATMPDLDRISVEVGPI